MKQSHYAQVKSLGRWLERCQCHRTPVSMESPDMALSWGSHTHPAHTEREPKTLPTPPTQCTHALHTGITSHLTPARAAMSLWRTSSLNIPCPSVCALSPSPQGCALLSFSILFKPTMAREGVGALCPSSLTGSPCAAHSPTAALAQLGQWCI